MRTRELISAIGGQSSLSDVTISGLSIVILLAGIFGDIAKRDVGDDSAEWLERDVDWVRTKRLLWGH